MHVPSLVGSLISYQGIAQNAPPASSGFTLIAEDGNPVPGAPRVQAEVFMAAGKTYDVMIDAPAAGGTALPVFDRELSLSGNKINRDSGMLAYVGVNGANADCSGMSIQHGATPSNSSASTGRIDPPWVPAEGWQGYSGQNNFIEFGKLPISRVKPAASTDTWSMPLLAPSMIQ
jgi:hypothetical protein